MSEPHDAVTLPPDPPGNDLPRPAGQDGYEILGELGRGGVGVVYRARHRRLNRVVALKMPLSGPRAAEAERVRFRTEAEALARLQHPNIVQIFEVGEHDGAPYLAMEFCGGGTLADALRDSPLPPKEAAGLVEALARAVQAAHAANVVHRDLKPGNVLLSLGERGVLTPPSEVPGGSRPPLAGVPKVTDFGLSRRLDDVGHTQTGAILGTPSYMAPEQAEAKKDVGPACDVWALGAVLYECLTGRPPFKAATTLDTLVQVTSQEPVPPSALNAKVPRDLETICLKCLQKPVGRRYGSAAELADDLGRYLRHEPIRARPVGVIGRACRWCRRNRAVAASLLAVAVTLVGAAAVSVGFALESREQAKAALAAKALADDESDKARQNEDRALRGLYASRMNLAQQAWFAGRTVDTFRFLSELEPKPGQRDYRGFEWYWLKRTMDSEAVLVYNLGVKGEGGERLAVSRDGKRLVVVGECLWVLDAATGKTLHRWADQAPRPLAGVALSLDGKLLATAEGLLEGDARPRVFVRSMPTGEKLGEVPGFWAAAFSADGTRLAALYYEGDRRGVRLWDWKAGRQVWSYADPSLIPTSVALSPDGRTLAVCGEIVVTRNRLAEALGWKAADPTNVRVLDLETGKARPAGSSKGPALRLAFSADGGQLATRTGGAVELIDTKTGFLLIRREGLAEPSAAGLRFAANGRLAACSGDSVLVWSGGFLGSTLATLRGRGSDLDVVWLPGGTRVASLGQAGFLAVRDVVEQEGQTLTPPGGCGRLAFLPAGEGLVTAADGSLKLISPTTGQPIRTYGRLLDLGVGATPAFAVSGDGRRLASVRSPMFVPRQPNPVELYDASGKFLRALPGEEASFVVALSHDGGLLARLGKSRATVWDTTDGGRLGAIELPDHEPTHAAFSPDGAALAVAFDRRQGLSSSLLIWDVPGRRQRLVVPTSSGLVHTLSVGDKGEVRVGGGLASAVYDLATGRELTRIETSFVRHAAFSPDGRRLATATFNDGEDVSLWDVPTGQQVARLPVGMTIRHGLAFSPDGQLLVASGRLGTRDVLRVWDSRPRPDRIVEKAP